MSPTQLVDRYFECMRGRDLEGLIGLFSADAAASFPDGKEVKGLADLRAMYEHVFAAGAPVPAPQARVVGEELAAIEVESRLPDGSIRRTANFIHIARSGLISRLSIYKRGNGREARP